MISSRMSPRAIAFKRYTEPFIDQILWKVRIMRFNPLRLLTSCCDGRITQIEFNPESKSAVVQFEKPSAAKTALMVSGPPHPH